MSAPASPQAGALAQRVILVSGAAGGLGSAAALACAQAGATVVLLGHKPARLNRVYDAIAAIGAAPLLYPLDLLGATPADYATLAERLQGELGRLDGLLHCAADFAGLTPFEHADPAQFARALHVNLTAAAWLTQACLPLLRQAEDAAIVFAVDDPARVGQAYWGGYGAAQHGRRGLLASLHGELAASRVRVAGLQPGPMRTALRARAYTHQEDLDAVDPARYAGACVELLSPAGAAHRGAIWNPLA
ncbi:NAD(P)-dependent dehydrogenase (short-subunit alcohol dehydrogenase family) [Xanthomonas sacchari]|uniref:SDR family NAD(P)-dependent oxidoreductase n=1 Tax=unclassified Xanthomonas TaxID=2643310 RepID=UPI0013684362|nr:NAD(P)-dependent dehydrogenase (short-subunit alcohol dehydrogenase family) [Xanthomonas sp. F10]MXV31986.1 SDR family NAD(P)-dependent oxidoreductase [Xanthomonas sp. LMG 8989]